MYEYIPDYTEQFEEYEEAQDRRTRKLPKCDCCGNRIAESKFYNIEGTYICKGCIVDYIVNTEDYMED